MAQRFYLADLHDRPAYFEDLGHRITISAVVMQGGKHPIVLNLPASTIKQGDFAEVITPTADEWSEIIRCSDDPQIFQLDKSGTVKIIHRKVRHAISGHIQQKVWVADGLRCYFCAAKIGDVPLTIDHFMPLDLGGKNVETNYITACRKCNKKKAGIHPKVWCKDIGLNFREVQEYLKNRKI